MLLLSSNLYVGCTNFSCLTLFLHDLLIHDVVWFVTHCSQVRHGGMGNVFLQTVGTHIPDDHNMNVPGVTQSLYFFFVFFELDFILRVYDCIDISCEFANYFMNPAILKKFFD